MKKNNAKRALLMSALSLLLCVSMLVGTTFAWFTDSVTSAGNKIQSGTLKVDLELLTSEGWESIKNSNDPIFNYENWEPGYVDVNVLKIENEGSLALKWYAKFQSAQELSALANVIDVYVLASETEIAAPADRTLAGYTNVGTVADFVKTIESTTYGTLLPKGVAYLGIALKMQESAGNEYQGLTLGAFDIQIVATQETYEPDSFNNQYDIDSKYPVTGTATKEVNNATTVSADNVAIEIPEEAPAGNYSIVISNKNETTDENGQTTYTADIDLLKDGVKVERNDNTVYLVTIQLETGKSIVKVLHKGVEVNDYDYDPESGILTFETDSFSPFSVIYEENKSVKVTSAEELIAALENVQPGAIIDATGLTLEPTGSLDTTIWIPAGVTLKGAKFVSDSQCYLVTDGTGDNIVFDACIFEGPGFGMFVIAGNDQDGAAMVFENCTFKGQIAPNFVQNSNGISTFNNCTFTVGSDNIGLVNCMGGTHTFNNCTFDYTGGSTFGSNQYVKWNAVNSYSESYSTKVILNGCTFKNCGTQRFGSNSTLTIK